MKVLLHPTKRHLCLLFAAFLFSLPHKAQTTFEEDSLQFVQEMQERRIPQLIEVRAEGDATLYGSPTDTTLRVAKLPGFPLFLMGDEGGFWACSYFGRLAFVRKSAAENTALIQKAINSVSRNYCYMLAYNALVQGLQLAIEYTEQAQNALGDNSINDEPELQAFLQSRHRELPDAFPYLDKIEPRAFYGK